MTKINYAESFKNGTFWEPFFDLVDAAAWSQDLEKVGDDLVEKLSPNLMLPDEDKKFALVSELEDVLDECKFAGKKVGFNAGYEVGFAAGAIAASQKKEED